MGVQWTMAKYVKLNIIHEVGQLKRLQIVLNMNSKKFKMQKEVGWGCEGGMMNAIELRWD